MDRRLDIDEAARYVRVPSHLLHSGLRYNLLDIPFQMVDGKPTFSRKELKAWLAQKMRVKTASQDLLKRPLGELTVAELRGYIAALDGVEVRE